MDAAITCDNTCALVILAERLPGASSIRIGTDALRRTDARVDVWLGLGYLCERAAIYGNSDAVVVLLRALGRRSGGLRSSQQQLDQSLYFAAERGHVLTARLIVPHCSVGGIMRAELGVSTSRAGDEYLLRNVLRPATYGARVPRREVQSRELIVRLVDSARYGTIGEVKALVGVSV